MHGSLFNDTDFVRADTLAMHPTYFLKFNNTRKTFLIRLIIFFISLFVIKYLWMFNMSYLSIELWSTEKQYTFSFKDASPDSAAFNPLEKLLRHYWVGKLIFLLSVLNSNFS